MRGRVAAGSGRGVPGVRRVLCGRDLALAALAAGLLLWGGAVQAQMRGPCAEELRKLCPDKKPGSSELRECFEQHKGDLSPQCQERMTQGKERLDKMRAACATDIETHCGDVPQHGGQLMQCLHRHSADLSDACKEAIPRRARMQRGSGPAPGKAPAKAPEKAPSPAPEAEE